MPAKSLNMSGPYELTLAQIAVYCTPQKPYGNYAFGKVIDGVFNVHYVGRFSKGGERIKHGVGRYSHFKLSHALNERVAFEKECLNYHDFTPPDNKIHPACPVGSRCPRGCP